jgi:hypothetical protein
MSLEHVKPPAIKNPGRARKAFAIILGLIAVVAVAAYVLALGHQEEKAPAPVRGDGVAPVQAATPGVSKPGSPG